MNKFRLLQNRDKALLASRIEQFTFTAAIDPELKCVRCGALPFRHYISGCQHIFCVNCFNDLRTQQCPKCQEGLDKIKLRKSDIGIERRIFSLEVYCTNRKLGCQETIPLFNLLEHEKACPFPLVTTVVNGNGHSSKGLMPSLTTTMKESSQWQHEGLSLVIKDRAASKLREEFQNKCETVAKNSEEELKRATQTLENLVHQEIEKFEFKLKEELIASQSDHIANESAKLKAEWTKDVNIVEDNAYLQLEKLTERMSKQEDEIGILKFEVETLSDILKVRDSEAVKSNSDDHVLVCGPSNHRTDFINAMVNYSTYKTSKMADDAGLIRLNPVYSTKKQQYGDEFNCTEYFQLPVGDSKFVRIISWGNPSQEAVDDEPPDFDFVDNSIFAILDSQFQALTAIYVLLDRSLQPSEYGFLRLLHYVDRETFKHNVKFIFVDDEESAVNKAEAVEFLRAVSFIAESELELIDDCIFWINLQPYKDKMNFSLSVDSDVDEDKWQNNVIENRRLLMSNNQSQAEEMRSNKNLVSSVLASKEAIRAISKLTNFYHQAVSRIVSNVEISKDLKSEIDEINERESQVNKVWFNRNKIIKQDKERRAQLSMELEVSQIGIKSMKHLLAKEQENVANLIARFKKYFKDNLVFQESFLDQWLWRYCVEEANGHAKSEEQRKYSGWLSIFNSQNPDCTSRESIVISNELWSSLRNAVKKVQEKLQLTDDDGPIEEGVRIGNHGHHVLEKMISHFNDM